MFHKSNRSSPTAVVMGKLPQPGRVKTRLCPPLSPQQAAGVHELFLRHTLERVADFLSEGLLARVVFCFDPAEAANLAIGDFGDIDPLVFLPQAEGDLGYRLAAAHGIEGKAGSVLFLGADSPDVPDSHLRAACASLTEYRGITLGPCDDGGFWCLGVGPGVDLGPILAGVEWSSGREMDQVREKAESAGLSVGFAPPWCDVDRPADLATLWDRLGRDDTPPGRRLWHGLWSLLTEAQRRDVLGWRPTSDEEARRTLEAVRQATQDPPARRPDPESL